MKSEATKYFTHLWNDMPYEERSRLMPYMIESQKLHIIQTRHKAIEAHERYLRDVEAWLKNLDSDLAKYKR